MKPVLETKELTKIFAAEGKSDFTAVDHVNFQLYPGEILGIVGESGKRKKHAGKGCVPPDRCDGGQYLSGRTGYYENKRKGSAPVL